MSDVLNEYGKCAVTIGSVSHLQQQWANDDEGHCRSNKQIEEPWYLNIIVLHINLYSGYSKETTKQEVTILNLPLLNYRQQFLFQLQRMEYSKVGSVRRCYISSYEIDDEFYNNQAKKWKYLGIQMLESCTSHSTVVTPKTKSKKMCYILQVSSDKLN